NVIGVASRRAVRQEPSNTTAPPHGHATYGTYFMPDINMAIICSVLLLIILTVGRTYSCLCLLHSSDFFFFCPLVCATCSIQTPERFEGAQVKKPVQRRA